MSWQMIGTVFKESKADNGCLLVMIGLANWVNEDGHAWPAVATLAKLSRLSERQVRTNLRKLEDMGEIAPVGKGPKGTIKYLITPGLVKTSGGEEVSAGEGRKSSAAGGEVSSPEPLKEPVDGKPLESTAPTAGAIFQEFVDRWFEAYEIQFQSKPRPHAADFAAAKRLLKASTPDDVMATATKAWAKGRNQKQYFYCSKATTISNLDRFWDHIIAELNRPMPGDIPRHAPKVKSGKPRAEDRPIPGDPDPATGKPLTRAEIETRFPLSNYEC